MSDKIIDSQQSQEPWPYEPEIVDRIDAIDRRADDYIKKGKIQRAIEGQDKYVEEEDEEEYLSDEDEDEKRTINEIVFEQGDEILPS